MSVTNIVSLLSDGLETWVRLRLEGLDLLTGIPVDDSELKVIAPTHNPVLSLNESACSYRDICEL